MKKLKKRLLYALVVVVLSPLWITLGVLQLCGIRFAALEDMNNKFG